MTPVLPVPAGRFVALEGIDGSGKSTQARRLAASLDALLTFEPGATALGRALREILLDGDYPAPAARAEALLMAADRAQHVEEVIRPALDSGRCVVSDRFSGSTLAYQGYGRGLGIAALRELVEWTVDGIAPDLTVLIDVPTSVAHGRLEAVAPDRLERLDTTFFSRVREGYLSLAAGDPAHWVVIDGDATVDVVAAELRATVTARLGGACR